MPVPFGLIQEKRGTGSSRRKWENTIRPFGSQATGPSAPASA